MIKGNDKSLTELLTELGFKSSARQGWTLWQLPENVLTAATGLQTAQVGPRLLNPWRVQAFELCERKGRLSVHRLVLEVEVKTLVANLVRLTKKYLGTRSLANFQLQEAAFWCLFEFGRNTPKSRKKSVPSEETRQPGEKDATPGGLGGFSGRLVTSGSHLSLVVSHLFGIGYVPPGFGTLALRYLAEAFGLKQAVKRLSSPENKLRGDTIDELRFPPELPALAWLAEISQAEPESLRSLFLQLEKTRALTQPALFINNERLTVLSPNDASQETSHLGQMPVTPLETLETREREIRYRDIDQVILAGKHFRAKKMLADGLLTDNGSLYLLRRLATLALENVEFIDESSLADCLRRDPKSLLFLSNAVNLALAKSVPSELLDCLSIFGEALLKDVAGSERLAVFDVVLPELLGDAWSGIEPGKATACYQRILQRRGDLPRILRKLVRIARKTESADQEIHYLKRLSKVERRQSEKAKVEVRLAELFRVADPQAAQEAARKALKLDRTNTDAALLLAGLLVAERRGEEAIQVLDTCLRDPMTQAGAKGKAKLEAAIGQIWLSGLGREDLAKVRFEKALAHDELCQEALAALETYYRKSGQQTALARILERQFDAAEAAKDGSRMSAIFSELATFYRGVLAAPDRAFKLYNRLIAVNSIDLSELDRVLAWSDIEIAWPKLYQKLEALLDQETSRERRALLLCRLAEICFQRLGEITSATRYWRMALDEGSIDGRGFELLVGILSEEKDYSALVEVYDQRLLTVKPADEAKILLEMLSLPKGLSDQRKDELAVRALSLSPGAEFAFKQRFYVYQGRNDFNGILHLVQTMKGQAAKGLKHVFWLGFAADVLEDCTSDRRFAPLGEIHKLIVELAEDRVHALQDAVASLKGAPDREQLTEFVAELVQLGLLPGLSETQVKVVLAGRYTELARYYELMSFKATSPFEASGHAKSAAEYYALLSESGSEYEKMLGRACSLSICSDTDLEALKAVVGKSKNWLLLARALEKQIELESESVRKYQLTEQLGVLFWKKLRDPQRAHAVFASALAIAPDTTRLQVVIARIAQESGDAGSEKQALLSLLKSAILAKDAKLIANASSRLSALGASALVREMLEPTLNDLIVKNDWAEAAVFAEALLATGTQSGELYRAAFRGAVRTNDSIKAAKYWYLGLQAAGNKSKAKVYIAEQVAMLEKEGRRDLLLACFESALINHDVESLGPKVRQELLLQHAALLFDLDETRERSYAVYKEAFAIDEFDHRSWLPLYFLLSEFGSTAERLEHLSKILPHLANDPRPLKAFPLTIESLTAELKQLSEQIASGPPSNAPALKVWPLLGSKSPASDSRTPFLQRPIPPEPLADFRFTLPAAAEPTPAVAWREPTLPPVLRAAAGEPELPAIPPPSPKTPKLELVLPEPAELSPESFSETLPSPIGQAEEGASVIEVAARLPVEGELSPIQELDIALGDQAALGSLPPPPVGLASLSDKPEAESSGLSPDPQAGGKDAMLQLFGPGGEPSVSSQWLGVRSEPSLKNGSENEVAALPGLELLALGSTGAKSPESAIGSDFSSIIPVVEVSEAVVQTQLVNSDAGKSPFSLAQLDSPENTGTLSLVELDFVMPNSPSQPELRLENLHDAVNETPTSGGPSVEWVASEGHSLSAATDLPKDGVGEPLDWRVEVIKDEPKGGITAQLLRQAFASELEKHVAVQCAALVEGATEPLAAWHWRVWRYSKEYGYSLSGKSRLPAGVTPAALQSNLQKLLLAIQPVLVRVYKNRFTQDYLAEKFQITAIQLSRLKRPAAWNDGAFQAAGLPLIVARSKRQYDLFILPGLGAEIFYDGPAKAFYIDEGYYRKAPPSHLFHRVYALKWAIRSQFFVPLALHPVQEVAPLLGELHQHFGSQGITRLKTRFSSGLTKHLMGLDLRQVRALQEKVGPPSEELLLQLWDAMRLQLQQLVLAETLDVIGLFEALLNKDLLKPDGLKAGDIFRLSKMSKTLVEFATKLKL